MSYVHPKSANRSRVFKVLAPFRLWRKYKENFAICAFSQNTKLDKLEEYLDFDLEDYKDMIRDQNNGSLPDGYYYANHATQTGGYLYTDDYDEVLEKLKKMKLIIDV